MQQILKGVAELHANGIFHRDLKPANVLVGDDGVLCVCDLGSARRLSPNGSYTPGLVTLWYRPPEILLGSRGYGKSVDMWSLGCILGELITGKVLFNGATELEQLSNIFFYLGISQ